MGDTRTLGDPADERRPPTASVTDVREEDDAVLAVSAKRIGDFLKLIRKPPRARLRRALGLPELDGVSLIGEGADLTRQVLGRAGTGQKKAGPTFAGPAPFGLSTFLTES
jgi:hypothetical protein